jgi:pimeloyl-ACP methyl ester carboxylesterase
MTMEQTVADLAYFIVFIRDLYNVLPTTRVILFGKEIGASIATWTQTQHPHLVTGVLASSAAMQSQLDNSQFLVNVGHTIRDFGSERCYERIENAFTNIALSIINNDVDDLNAQFRVCTELNTTSDLEVASFKVAITMVMAVYVQQSTPALMEAMCDSITDESRDDDVAALAHWMMEDFLGVLPCFEYSFENIIREYSEVNWDTTASAYGGRQAYYLQCTQIPNYPTTASNDQPFGDFLELGLFAQSCMILFGDQ